MKFGPTTDVQVPGSRTLEEAKAIAIAFSKAIHTPVQAARFHDGYGSWSYGLSYGDGFGDSQCTAAQRYLSVRDARGGDLVLYNDGLVYTVSRRGVALIHFETGVCHAVDGELAREVVEAVP